MRRVRACERARHPAARDAATCACVIGCCVVCVVASSLVPGQSALLLLVGVFGTFAAVLILAFEVFPRSVTFPFVLVTLGVAFVWVGTNIEKGTFDHLLGDRAHPGRDEPDRSRGLELPRARRSSLRWAVSRSAPGAFALGKDKYSKGKDKYSLRMDAFSLGKDALISMMERQARRAIGCVMRWARGAQLSPPNDVIDVSISICPR